MTNMGVHLTQLISKSVKASIHVHKLCHHGLKCHSTHWRRRSGGGWSSRSWRSCCLCLGLPQAKLCKTPLNSSSINGTHIWEVGRLRKGDRKVAKESHDSGRKNELIKSRRVLIDIYKDLPFTREMIIFFLIINHWGLMLTLLSKGFFQTLLGKFCFATLEGATFVPWTHEGVCLWYQIHLGFSWWS